MPSGDRWARQHSQFGNWKISSMCNYLSLLGHLFIPSSYIQIASSVKIDVSRIASAQQKATLGSKKQESQFTKNTQEPPWASEGGEAVFMANDSHPLEETLPALQGSFSIRVLYPKWGNVDIFYSVQCSEDYYIIPVVQYLHFNMCNSANHWGLFFCYFVIPIAYSIFYNIPLCLNWVNWFSYCLHFSDNSLFIYFIPTSNLIFIVFSYAFAIYVPTLAVVTLWHIILLRKAHIDAPHSDV